MQLAFTSNVAAPEDLFSVLESTQTGPSKCLSASVEGLSCTELWERFIIDMEEKYTMCNNSV